MSLFVYSFCPRKRNKKDLRSSNVLQHLDKSHLNINLKYPSQHYSNIRILSINEFLSFWSFICLLCQPASSFYTPHMNRFKRSSLLLIAYTATKEITYRQIVLLISNLFMMVAQKKSCPIFHSSILPNSWNSSSFCNFCFKNQHVENLVSINHQHDFIYEHMQLSYHLITFILTLVPSPPLPTIFFKLLPERNVKQC